MLALPGGRSSNQPVCSRPGRLGERGEFPLSGHISRSQYLTVIVIIVRRPVKEGRHPVVVVHLLLVVEPVRVALGAVVPVQVDLEAALHLERRFINDYCLSSASSAHIAQRVAAALTVRAGLGGDGDVDDPVDADDDAVVVGAGGGRDGTVLVRLTAGLALESLEVAVLTDLLLPGLLHVADQPGPLAGSLLTALPGLALAVRSAGPVRTVLISATLRVGTEPGLALTAGWGGTVGVGVALSLALPCSTAVANLQQQTQLRLSSQELFLQPPPSHCSSERMGLAPSSYLALFI